MSVLDLIGLQRIFHNGVELFRRKNLNFLGGTVTDNPKTDSTDINIGEGGGGGGAVASVFGRTGAVMAVLGDYTSSLVNNASVVTGETVTIALNTLNAVISSLITTVSGKVSGPASATDGVVSLFSGTTGKVIKTSLVSIDSSGNITTPGLVDGRDVSLDGAKLDGIPPGGGGPAAPSSAPPAVAAAGATGTAGTYATATHTHAHGDQGGGTLHAPATTTVPGFLSAADKTKLNAVVLTSVIVWPSGNRTLAATDNGATLQCTAPGTPQLLIPADATLDLDDGFLSAVVFDVASGGPLQIVPESGVVVVGLSAPLALAPQAGATLQKVGPNRWWIVLGVPETPGVALSSTLPSTTAAASSLGVENAAARGDHVHGHGNLLGGSLHALATTTTAGFASAADKVKIDGAVQGPASAVDNAVTRFDLTTGKLVQTSLVIINDAGDITTPGTINGVNLSDKANALVKVVTVAEVQRTLSLNELNALLVMTNEDAAVIVPNNADVALPIGYTVLVFYDFLGETSCDFVLGSSVVVAQGPFVVMANDTVGLTKVGTDRWSVVGEAYRV
jgi:hypothetical protein